MEPAAAKRMIVYERRRTSCTAVCWYSVHVHDFLTGSPWLVNLRLIAERSFDLIEPYGAHVVRQDVGI